MQQVQRFYQHRAGVTGIYIQQMLKGKILPTVRCFIHLGTTAAICEIPLGLQPPRHGHKSSFRRKLPLQPRSNPQSPKGLNPCARWILVLPRSPGTRLTAGQPRHACLVQGMQYNGVKTPRSASPYPWFVFLCLLISFSPSMIH